MMKNIAIINNVDFGSTGQISLNLHRDLLAKGYRSYFAMVVVHLQLIRL